MKIRKADVVFIALIPLILLCLWMLTTEQTTLRIPLDDDHIKLIEIYETEGKKAAGKNCSACHGDEAIPLSENHPPKYRCMFCHKFENIENNVGPGVAEG